jgi:hypothetical protein
VATVAGVLDSLSWSIFAIVSGAVLCKAGFTSNEAVRELAWPKRLDLVDNSPSSTPDANGYGIEFCLSGFAGVGGESATLGTEG